MRQQAAADPLEFQLPQGAVPPPCGQHPHLRLLPCRGQDALFHLRRQQRFHELLVDDLAGGLPIQGPVKSDDAAEGGHRVCGVSPEIRRGDGLGLGGPTGIGVFDDDAGGFGKPGHALQGGVRIGDVVVGQGLALQLPGRRHGAAGGARVCVKRRGLVGVLTVSQFPGQPELHGVGVWVVLARAPMIQAPQVIGHIRVVIGGVGKNLLRQAETGGVAQPIFVLF